MRILPTYRHTASVIFTALFPISPDLGYTVCRARIYPTREQGTTRYGREHHLNVFDVVFRFQIEGAFTTLSSPSGKVTRTLGELLEAGHP
jgi:hypothetical protein